MKKLLKVVAVVVGVLAALLVIATLALKIFFPAEKIKGLLLSQLTTKLNRDVAMDQVSLGLIKGLEIENLRIADGKTFSQGTFVTVDKLDVRVRLLPLLAKRVEVDTLVLAAPKISITRAADGKTFNFSDLLASGAPVARVAEADCKGLVPCAYAAPGEPSAAAAPPVNLQISKLEIQNGQVHFVDHSPARQSADIDELNLKVGGFSLTDFFNATLHAKIKTMGMTVLAQVAAKLNLQTSAVQLSNATFTIGESKIQASGKVSDYASAAPAIALNVVINALTPASFGAMAPLPPALVWNGLATGNVDLDGNLAALNVGGNVHLDGVQLQYGKLFAKPAKVPFSLSFNGRVLKQSTADIKEWGLKLGSLSATGSARIDGLAQKLPTLSLHLVTNDFSTSDVVALLPGVLPPGIKIQGPAKIAADVVGTPASFKATAKVSGQDLAIVDGDTFKKPAGMAFEATFNGESVGNGSRLNIESLLLVLGHIQMTLAGQYMPQGQDARLALTLHSNDFALDDLPKLSPAAAPYQFSGAGHLDAKVTNLTSAPTIDGTFALHQANVKSADEQVQQADAHIHFTTPNALAPTARLLLKTDGQVTAVKVHQQFYDGSALKLVWALSDVTEDLSRISGTAQFNQGPGIVHQVDKLAQQSKIAKLLLSPIQTLQQIQDKGLFKDVGLPSLHDIPFSSIHGDYAFRTGTADIHTFDLVGNDLSLNTTGTAGLAGAQPLNLHNQMTLGKGSIGGTVGQLLQHDDQGRPIVKFTITGTADKPQVKFDLQEVGQNAVKKLLDGVSGNDPGKALDQISNNLKNLFK